MRLQKIYLLYLLSLISSLVHADFIRGLERLWDAITGKKESVVQIENIKKTALTCGNADRTATNALIHSSQLAFQEKKRIRTEANVSGDNEKNFINKEIAEREEIELRKLYSRGSLYTSLDGEICGLARNEQDACDALAASNSLGQEILHPIACDLVDANAVQPNPYQQDNAESSVTCVVATKADMDIIKKDGQGYIQMGNDSDGVQESIAQFLKDGKVTTTVEYPACGSGYEQDLKNACLFKLNSGNIIQLRPQACTLIPVN